MSHHGRLIPRRSKGPRTLRSTTRSVFGSHGGFQRAFVFRGVATPFAPPPAARTLARRHSGLALARGCASSSSRSLTSHSGPRRMRRSRCCALPVASPPHCELSRLHNRNSCKSRHISRDRPQNVNTADSASHSTSDGLPLPSPPQPTPHFDSQLAILLLSALGWSHQREESSSPSAAAPPMLSIDIDYAPTRLRCVQ